MLCNESPDGSQLAISDLNKFWIQNIATKEVIMEQELKLINYICFNQDGSEFIVGTVGEELTI